MGEIAQARKDLNFMPDALSIIPSVVEEMCEEDQMEIESKHGSIQDDTLAACIQCLLQCFNPDSGKGQSNESSISFFIFFYFSCPERKKEKKERKKRQNRPFPLASYPC